MPEKSFEGEDFLKEQYWGKEEFREAVERSLQSKKRIVKRKKEAGKTEEDFKIPPKPKEQIPHYLELIKNVAQRHPELLKRDVLYKKFIVKPENISGEYFKNIFLGNFAEQAGYTREQTQDPQIKELVIKQFEESTNQKFGQYQIPEKEHQELVDQIVNDQKTSLERWLQYLTSPEAQNYPEAFRYFAFAEMLKLGSYDRDRKKFTKRETNTAAPFPELNHQALAVVLDELKRYQEKQEIALPLTKEQEEELQKLLLSQNFGNLYGWSLEYVTSLIYPEEKLQITDGQWKQFKKGSDPNELVKQIQQYRTDWCIAGQGTAQSYLRRSDIWIYFSNESDKPDASSIIPRAAIVSDGQTISEVRGIFNTKETKQHLDNYITPLVSEKLKELPGGQEWQGAIEDAKKLTSIYLKQEQGKGEELDNDPESLKFLYQVDKKIGNTGYGQDPRIQKIISKRNLKKDLAFVFHTTQDKISTTEKEYLRGDILFHYGDLYLSSLTSAEGLKLPESVGGDLNLGNLTSAEGLKLPESVGGGLYLTNLTSAEGLKLPESVGGYLNLNSLTSAEGLKLPEHIGGDLNLNNLTSAEGLKLPEHIGGYLNLNNLTSAEENKLKKNHPHLKDKIK